MGRRFVQQGNANPDSLKLGNSFEKVVYAMSTMKILLSVVLLSGGLSIPPGIAGTFDGAMFSVQDRGFGAQQRSDNRRSREARPSQYVPPDKGRARGQLTEEERRQLHRDLDKANREIYGGRRGR
jgi:hypothetical protein